ncbi:MAG: hypothetical protein K0R31_260 [Clostridiales bacterium]|nr:hypothetical protein [Clostridiales bacterium]
MNFIKNRKGSITIFQLIIFSALLLMTGVLVDAVRIMTAERTVQSALNTAARSTLAEYDDKLVGDYGLFAIDASAQDSKLKEHFMKYLNYNISDNNKEFRFIDYEVNPAKTGIMTERNLLNNNDNAFKEQIVEYMKYKAPILITKNVVDRVLSSGIFKKREFAGKEKVVRYSSNEVKEAAGNAASQMSKLNNDTRVIESYTVNEYNSNEFLNRLKTLKTGYQDLNGVLNTLGTSIEVYRQKVRLSNEFGEKANKDESLQGDAAIQMNGSEFEHSDESIEKAGGIVACNVTSLDILLPQVEPLLLQIDLWLQIVESLNLSNIQLQSEIMLLRMSKGGESTGRQIERLSDNIQKNNEKIYELKLKIKENTAKVNSLKSSFRPDEFTNIDLNPADGSKKNYANEAPDTSANNSQLNQLKTELEQYISGKNIKEGWLIAAQDFEQAEAENDRLIQGMQNRRVSEDENKAEADNEDAFKLLDQLKGALNSGMENMFVVEYILDRFSYHTSLAERGHYFEKGEVEFILWGARQQNLNIAAAVSTISLLRFAINTIDYFATSEIPHPVLRLVYSVGRGLAQAFKDSFDLYNGKQIPIIPSLNNKGNAFQLNYADHLRMFLLMQSVTDSRKQLNNIRELIQVNLKSPDENGMLQNPEFQLGKYRTIINGKVEANINLWFLPLLQLDKVNSNSFKGGKYIIIKEISIGY